MRKAPLLIAAIVIVTGILYACSQTSPGEKKPPVMTEAEMVKRGDYLVSSIGCDDCHSPKRFGPNGPEVIPELRLSGYPASRPITPVDSNATKGWMLFSPDLTAAVGPWGMSFSANLTSDGTGIGAWTEYNFITAMRTGKMKGLENGRPMLPPMPWPNFRNLNDDDLKSIFAYLKTTAPVVNRVPEPKKPGELK